MLANDDIFRSTLSLPHFEHFSGLSLSEIDLNSENSSPQFEQMYSNNGIFRNLRVWLFPP